MTLMKRYVLRLFISLKYITANVVDRNNGLIVATSSTVEHSVKQSPECGRTCNAKAAAIVGEVLQCVSKWRVLIRGKEMGSMSIIGNFSRSVASLKRQSKKCSLSKVSLLELKFSLVAVASDSGQLRWDGMRSTGWYTTPMLVWLLCHGFASVKLIKHSQHSFPACASIGEALLGSAGFVIYFGDMFCLYCC
ncbi:hypothetical protein HAX54_010112 [Datura stramonium]|uniref:Uncharacterized protein n=1 Tax=Datura stramonium TaxID=4076 RepID=A0ABS8WZF1_DATST|nr:hypothetical protein [Datura stramonium]